MVKAAAGQMDHIQIPPKSKVSKCYCIKGKFTKIIHCHATNLVGFRTFRQKIAGLFIPQDLFKHMFTFICSNNLAAVDGEDLD